VRLILEGKQIKLFGDGEQIRDANYVDDVIDAFLLAGASEEVNGQVYNLGGTPTSLLQVAQVLVELRGGTYTLTPYPPEMKPIEIGDYIADWSKISDALGWRPGVDIKEGLKRTLEYYDKRRTQYF